MELMRQVKCTICNGTGVVPKGYHIDDYENTTCEYCDGGLMWEWINV